VHYARSADWVSAATAVLASAAKSGGVFHLWGHSWEIEEAGQWSALDEILAGMAAYRKDASCLTNAELCDYGK
jgi:peptidoglycan-N-acetylglucosamine deacetylase